ncbi:MAG: hypothetical protein ACAH59_05450 [Pseudobdellovibrionaceae bacterium]
MSIKKILFFSVLGFGLGLSLSYFYQKTNSRNLASTLPAPKLKILPWAHDPSSKPHQALQVEISAVGGIPDHDEQELRLKAEVTLNRPIDQEVKFQWSLPPDASVVSGELEDAWPNLLPGQKASTEIIVTGVSKESVAKTVTLHVSALSNGVNFAGSGSFATNSAAQMQAADTEQNMKVQNSELALKKDETAAKMKRVHQ